MSEKQKAFRKLSAIFSADVKGYSRLMADDEFHTIETLKKYRKIMTGIIQKHTGRVVDAPGDNMLAEFSSVVHAVQGAVSIQKELKKRNDELPHNKRLIFRIGINIGDVIQDGDNLYGEGVNITARIEGITDPGGICVSRGVYDHIKNKLSLGYEYIGEHSVKNIKDPVRVYRILISEEDAGKRIGETSYLLQKNGLKLALVFLIFLSIVIVWQFFHEKSPPMEKVSLDNMAFPLPSKPSIAVLAFDNMSGNQEQKYFCDGLAEEIIAALSSVPELFVIARNSSFAYKGKPVKAQQISEELGVQYILEGSVRKSGENVRITAQLIDALNGKNLWAENYDCKEKDTIALQEDIAMKVITELQAKITGKENIRIRESCSQNPKAYLKYLKALGHVQLFTKENNLAAMRLAKEAIALDPEYACAYSLLGGIHWLSVILGLSQSPKEDLVSAMQMVSKAIELKPSYAGPHAILARIKATIGQYDQALIDAEKSIATNPESGTANLSMGFVLMQSGKAEEAIPFLKKTIRLDPFATPSLYMLGAAYFFNRQYEEAIETSKKVLNQNPEFSRAWRLLAASYSAVGRMEEAKAAASSFLKFEPGFNLEKFSKNLKYKNPSDKDLIINNLKKAGLPENSPLLIPDRLSIAVLPFNNMTGDSSQDYFSDGITEQIITSLSNVPDLFVIARNSTFVYKNKPVKVQQIAADLGVKYILEGSVQKTETRLRITAQLIDAISGHHLWAENYDRKITDIFRIQDEITKEIIAKLQIELSATELGRLSAIKTDNLKAYEKYLKGHKHISKRTFGDTLKARKFAEESIKLDPEYGAAYQLSALTYLDAIFMHKAESPSENLHKAENLIHESVRLSGDDYMTHRTFSMIYYLKKQFDKSIDEAYKAVELNPNSAECQYMYGMILGLLGNHEKAIPVLERAIRLNPVSPIKYLNQLARQYLFLNQYDKAIPLWEETLKKNSEYYYAHMSLIVAYQLTGEIEKAKESVKELIRIKPTFTVSFLEKRFIQKGKSNKEFFLKALREAGLPE